MPYVTNQFHEDRATELFPETSHKKHTETRRQKQKHNTSQGVGQRDPLKQRLTETETKRGLTSTRLQLVMLNGSLGTHQGPSLHLWIRPGEEEARFRG